ncbi:MAG TPA: hypothetical protein VM142_14595 [Acidimicrobiales bacterium]|nr:hypothetical protein [Acidimicrobiales bacterium]
MHEALGAGPPAGVDQVTLFVPSVDRYGERIDQTYWTEQALTTFGHLFRGATAFPPGRGVWRDDERGGELVYDDTQMVTSYVAEGAFGDDDIVRRLKEFLCRMGRDANQGEVGIVIDGTYYGIVDYEEGTEE